MKQNKNNSADYMFGWNPSHPIGTCALCGEELVYNVPRLGPKGGYVHKNTRSLTCSKIDNNETLLSKL
jgi:hypothetical protein